MTTWFTNHRDEWIKEAVDIFGFVNREHIMVKFGVSAQQASTDLSRVKGRWPGLMAYNASTKQYERQSAGEQEPRSDARGEE